MQLGEDAARMHLDGDFLYAEFPRDLFVGAAAGEQFQNFNLAVGERFRHQLVGDIADRCVAVATLT